MPVHELNQLSDARAREEILRCCNCKRWVDAVLEQRPFASFSELIQASDRAFEKLQREDWLEAFSGHPKIGDMNSLRKRLASTRAWSLNEQSGVNDADDVVVQKLADGNIEYEKRFGYIFIVCATGKSAAEMLEILQGRIGNDPEQELKIAAHEQTKITKIRLEKLCQEVPSQPTC